MLTLTKTSTQNFALRILLNSIVAVEECDATADDSSTEAD